MPNVPILIHVLVGAGLLLAGRRLFWLFVGGVGFLAGFMLAKEYLPQQTETMHLVLAVGAGIAGAALAYVAQKVALSVGGFLAGGFLGVTLVRDLLGTTEPVPEALFLVVGVAGLVLVHIVFDWALVLLSSVAGAYVLSQLLSVSDVMHLVLVAVLSAVGVAVQKGLFEPKKKRPTSKDVPKKNQGTKKKLPLGPSEPD